MTKLILPLLFLVFFQNLNAQFLADNQDATQHKGLFNFHYDKKADKVFLEVEHTTLISLHPIQILKVSFIF